MGLRGTYGFRGGDREQVDRLSRRVRLFPQEPNAATTGRIRHCSPSVMRSRSIGTSKPTSVQRSVNARKCRIVGEVQTLAVFRGATFWIGVRWVSEHLFGHVDQAFSWPAAQLTDRSASSHDRNLTVKFAGPEHPARLRCVPNCRQLGIGDAQLLHRKGGSARVIGSAPAGRSPSS